MSTTTLTLTPAQRAVLSVGIFDYMSWLEPADHGSDDDWAALGIDKDADDEEWNEVAALLGDTEAKLNASAGVAELNSDELGVLADAAARLNPADATTDDMQNWAAEAGLDLVAFASGVTELGHLLDAALGDVIGN